MPSSFFGAPQQTDCSKLSDKEAAMRGKEQALKLNWVDAARYYQCAYDKKPKPEYKKELDLAKAQVADQIALEAEQLLKAENFERSSKRLDDARQYANTEKVKGVQAAYDSRADGLQKQSAAALARAQNGDPDGALKQMQALSKYAFVLPTLDAEIRSATDLKVKKLLSEGDQFIAQHAFDDASLRYQSAKAIRSDEPWADAGINKALAGRQAYFEFDRARELREKKQFKAAKDAIDAALRVYPDSSFEYEPVRIQIVNDWREFLANSIGPEAENEQEFEKVLPIYLNALQLRALDPADTPPPKLKEIHNNLANASAVKAREYKRRFDDETDPARLGMACLLLSNAKQLGASDPAMDTDLDSLLSNFARKRNTRIILSVDTATVADPFFVAALNSRCLKIVEGMQLQDLSIYSKDDWEKMQKNPAQKDSVEDPVSVPADSKSAYIRLKVSLDQFIRKDKELQGSRSPTSNYVAGQKSIPNPEYDALFAKVRRVESGFDKISKDRYKKTIDGWTYSEMLAYKQKLEKMPQTMLVDDVKPYQYQESDYSQDAAIQVSLKVIDNWSTSEVISDVINKTRHRAGTEITRTMNEKDTNGKYDRKLEWLTAQQDLDQLQTEVQQALDDKIPVLLETYLNRFYNSGMHALDQKRYDDAVEDLFTHWAFYRGWLEPKITKLIADLIMEKTGFDLVANGKALITKLTERKR
jgi:hypothetical protein